MAPIRRGSTCSRTRWTWTGYVERSDGLRGRRDELRRALGLEPGEVGVLCVARLVAEKGLDTLLRASAEAGPPIVPVLVGDGPERERLAALADTLRLRAVFVGDVPWDQVVEAYSACDVFALLSQHEPWGVVVNEAAACGLPLVLSEHVGAAYDLLRSGENGMLVPPDDVAATAGALRQLADGSRPAPAVRGTLARDRGWMGIRRQRAGLRRDGRRRPVGRVKPEQGDIVRTCLPR